MVYSSVKLACFILASSSLHALASESSGNGTYSMNRNITKSVSVSSYLLKKDGCLDNPKDSLTCCVEKLANYPEEWSIGGHYLQNLFVELKELKCFRLLRRFCNARTYGRFSAYSNLVYEYHCDEVKFQRTCKSAVTSNLDMVAESPWADVMASFNSLDFSLTTLTEPCMQIAAYDSVSGGYGFYHEIIAYDVPFCRVVWCGFDSKTIERDGISTWTCMPNSCRAGIIVVAVLSALLAIAIIMANLTVILVFLTTPKLRNSQAIYKISLGIADLLVGLVVLPTFVSSLFISHRNPINMGRILKHLPSNVDGTRPRKPVEPTAYRFSREYMGLVGFFTVLSLIVSINSLMMASFDRLMAIHSPLRYRKHKAKTIAVWSSLALWVVGIFFSALPLFVENMSYGVVASVMIASIDAPALILYSVVMLIPLVLVWVTTLSSYAITKKQATVRSKISVRSQSSARAGKDGVSMETKLARTLATMVGVFTACLTPSLIVLIAPHGISSIYPAYPKEFSPTASMIYTSVEVIAIFILMTNSLWNCFIYNARNAEFKRRAKDLYAKALKGLSIRNIMTRTESVSSTSSSRRSTLTTNMSVHHRGSTNALPLPVERKESSTPIMYRYTRENSIPQQ